MKSVMKLALISLGLSAICLSNSAQAQATGNASISNFSYRLVDLNTRDGITPSISFSNTQTSVSTDYSDMWGDRYQSSRNGNDVSAIQTSQSAGGVYVFSELDGNHFATSARFDQLGQFDSSARFNRDFILSPNTALIFSGNVALGSNFNLPSELWGNTIYAMTNVRITDIGANGSPPSHGAVFERGITAHSLSDSAVLNTNFTLAFVNRGANQLHGNVSAFAVVNGAIAAVPEPETYGMMLLGLGVLGMLARRRAKR